MKRNSRSMLGNPFLAWSELAWNFGEMSLASMQVFAHRTTRMAAAGPLLSARDREEFTRMGLEKVEAASESAQAVAARWITMNLNLGASVFRHMVTGGAAVASLTASRDFGQFVTRQAKLVETMCRASVTAREWSESTARLADRGLKPIHARATANAKRLARR
jgi:hypothetical protein